MNKITRMHILGHKVLEYDVDERGIIIDERERNRTHLDPKGGSYLVKEDSGDGIPSAIKKSMVLWYDIKKQGATNESLAANPVLTDLSGNGHDLTLHNFAFAGNSGIGGENNEYPNALVTDGVDDYGIVEGLPLLEDYTVIAKRKWLDYNKTVGLLSKCDGESTGAFGFEIIGNGGAKILRSYMGTGKPSNDEFEPSDVTYMTATSYNGIAVKRGTAVDNDKLALGKFYVNMLDTNSAKLALSSVLLFNRSLSQEEINWVKENLIEEIEQ